MKIWKEFKEFAVRGNVVDMAVGIIVGAAFGKIINSLVSDIIMPPIASVTKQIDFSNLFFNFSGGNFQKLRDVVHYKCSLLFSVTDDQHAVVR